MTAIILVCIFAVVLIIALIFLLKKTSDSDVKVCSSLPSGKNIPSRQRLAKMNANMLVREYSKADLEWLRRYTLAQIPNIPLGYSNVSDHMTWLDISRELDIALYGWTRK